MKTRNRYTTGRLVWGLVGCLVSSAAAALAAPPQVAVYAVPDEGEAPLEVRIVVRAVNPDGLPMYCKLSYRGDASPFERENWFISYPPFPEIVFTNVYDANVKDYAPTVTCQGAGTVSDSSPVTVRNAPTNGLPVVALVGPAAAVSAALAVPVVLDASDPDGDPLACRVDWGEYGAAQESRTIEAPHPELTVQHAYRRPGRYRVQALCADGRGGSATGQATVDVVLAAGNANPNLDLVRLNSITGTAPYTASFRVQSISDSTSDTLSCEFDAKDGLGPRPFTLRPPYANVTFSATYTEELELAFPVVQCWDGRGGSKSDQDYVAVLLPAGNAEPQVALAASATTGAAPLAVQFTVQAGDPNGDVLHCVLGYGFEEGEATFDVRPGDPARTFEHVYAEGDAYQARVECHENRGGFGDAAVWIDVEPYDRPDNYAPIVRLRPSKTAGDARLAVSFFVSGVDPEGDDVTCVLDFGDGLWPRTVILEAPTYSDETVPHVYYTAARDPYTATLVCRDADDGVAAKSAQITVDRPATAVVPEITTFAATPVRGEAPLSVAFALAANDPDSTSLNCTLDYGDGQRFALFALDPFSLTRTHVYAAGEYTARLYCCDDVPGGQICGPSNIGVASASVGIVSGAANAPPQVGLQVSTSALEASFTVVALDPDGDTLACELDPGVAGATWSFEVAAPYDAVSGTQGYPEVGTYVATVTCRDDHGAQGSTSAVVVISPRRGGRSSGLLVGLSPGDDGDSVEHIGGPR